MATIGEGSQFQGEFVVYDWRIKNFLSLLPTGGKSYKSPLFQFGGTSWNLIICPRTGTGNTSLLLVRNSFDPPITVDVTLDIKTADRKIACEVTYTYIFTQLNAKVLLQRLELSARKYQLMSSDYLTVVCKIQHSKSAEITIEKCLTENCKEISTQTEEETGYVSLCQDYQKVLLEGSHHDLILRVSDREFPVHRDILKARSIVFWSMLELDMKEKNSDSVEIPDCRPNAMQQFLLFVYSGKVETLDQNNMMDLYYTADKYDVKDLQQECREFIKKSLSVRNICKVIQLAMNHCDSVLLEKATEYFGANMVGIMRTVEWQVFMKENSTVANELLLKCIEKSNSVK